MISVTITRSALQQRGACSQGIALFDRIVAMRGWRHSVKVRDWTPLHDAWIASAFPGFASWLIDQALIPRADLSGADLSGASLSGANLYGANLSGADRSRYDAPIENWRLENGILLPAK